MANSGDSYYRAAIGSGLNRRGAGTTIGAMDVAECGAAFAIDSFEGWFWLERQNSEIRGIDTLFEDRSEGVAIEGWKLEGCRIAIAQSVPEIRDISFVKVPEAVIQPDPEDPGGTGFQDDDVAILVAVNVANTQPDPSGTAMECEGAFFEWATETDAYFVSVPLAVAESGAGRDEINLAVAV
jgi:hypothetical protein